MLTQNASNTARERLTLIRLFEELRALGYDGGYDAVRRYAKTWTREHASQTASAYVPLSLATAAWASSIGTVIACTLAASFMMVRRPRSHAASPAFAPFWNTCIFPSISPPEPAPIFARPIASAGLPKDVCNSSIVSTGASS